MSDWVWIVLGGSVVLAGAMFFSRRDPKPEPEQKSTQVPYVDPDLPSTSRQFNHFEKP